MLYHGRYENLVVPGELMKNESRRSFFLVLILSLSLHLAIVFAILVMQFKDLIKDSFKNDQLTAQPEHSAQVVFKQPEQQPSTVAPTPVQQAQHQTQPQEQEQPLPAPFFPLIEKPEPEIEMKKPPMIMTSGDAAQAAVTTSQQAEKVEQQKLKPLPQPKIEQKPKEKPIEQIAEKKEESEPRVKKAQEKPEVLQEELSALGKNKTLDSKKTTLTAQIELPKIQAPKILEKPLSRNVFQQQQQLSTPSDKKQITLTDIVDGFINRPPSEHVGTGMSTTSNHVATVIGAPAGAATEEQLRYERYAVKLMACINNSFAILFPQFRFVSKPSTREVNFTFVMDVNIKGDITALNIKQGSGNQQFDDFMVKLLYHAAKSFPPLPSYFNTNVCSFPIQCIMPTGIM